MKKDAIRGDVPRGNRRAPALSDLSLFLSFSYIFLRDCSAVEVRIFIWLPIDRAATRAHLVAPRSPADDYVIERCIFNRVPGSPLRANRTVQCDYACTERQIFLSARVYIFRDRILYLARYSYSIRIRSVTAAIELVVFPLSDVRGTLITHARVVKASRFNRRSSFLSSFFHLGLFAVDRK